MSAKSFNSIAFVLSIAGLLSSCASPTMPRGIQSQVIGAWEAVSLTNINGNVRQEPMGAGLKGRLSLDPEGYFSIIIMRADLPKLASGNRLVQTPEESKTIATGLLYYYGRYSIENSSKTLTINIEGSSFPNWNGVTQQRLLEVEGDRLTMKNQTTAVGGGSSELVWHKLP
jgi:lipocalin-like protein